MVNRSLVAWVPVVVALTACSAVSEPGAGGGVPTVRHPDDAASATPGGPVGSPRAPSYAPQPGDDRLIRGQVFLDASDVRIAESYPPQIFLALAGSLPTPCHQLRVAIAPPDPQKQIDVDVYSVIDPDVVCVQVLQAFEQNVALGSFPAGTYTIWVNGEQVGEFTG